MLWLEAAEQDRQEVAWKALHLVLRKRHGIRELSYWFNLWAESAFGIGEWNLVRHWRPDSEDFYWAVYNWKHRMAVLDGSA